MECTIEVRVRAKEGWGVGASGEGEARAGILVNWVCFQGFIFFLRRRYIV